MLKTSTNTYNNIEKGPTMLISKWLPMLAEIYHVNIISFFEGIDELSDYADELRDYKTFYESKQKENSLLEREIDSLKKENNNLKLERNVWEDNISLLKKMLKDKEIIISLMQEKIKE